MLTIGQEIEYLKHSKEEGVYKSIGKVKAIGLDAENRIIVLVHDTQRLDDNGNPLVCNTFLPCVNPTPEYEAQFEQLVKDVAAIEDEANANIRKLTNDANAAIGKLHDELVGAPVEL